MRTIIEPLKECSGMIVTMKAVFREKKDEWDLNLPALETLYVSARQTYDDVAGLGYKLNSPRKGTTLYEAMDFAKKIDSELKSLQKNRPKDITEVNLW